MSKVLEKLIYGRIALYLTTCSNQFGVKAKHSTDMTIYALTEAILQLNCCVLTRRKSGPIETVLSGHASAVLRVILTKETLYVAWLL